MATKHPQLSAFAKQGLQASVSALITEIQELYVADALPWIVGYSGGKDSTAVLQLVWLALAKLAPSERRKPVHVISTDTLVENPVVASWVSHSLEVMRAGAIRNGIPVEPHRLTPAVTDTFWVNLIGRGYPAPRHKFRWCTERLKIKPSNTFITEVVNQSGEAILVLGTRKAESAIRARSMDRLEERRVRDRLSPNASLPNCLVYSPVEDWSNDDVWVFLMQFENPWGYNNKDLLTMYQGASPDGECPLVVDTTTPSCGDSRFGCWVCTLVDQDKSMSAMIHNDEEKEWMMPLLKLRNELDLADDRSKRDFRRMNGLVQLFHDRPIPGPYTQASREDWLRKLLRAQQTIRGNPNTQSPVRSMQLITLDELREIRRVWVVEKHELEDSVPRIYADEVGERFPDGRLDDNAIFGAEELAILKELCGEDALHYELVRELLHIEQRFRTMARRSGLYDALEKAFSRGSYSDAQDALDRALRRRDSLAAAKAAGSSEAGAQRDGADGDRVALITTEPPQ